MDDLIRGPNEAIGLSSPVTQANNGCAERLRDAHAEAVAQIERIRDQPGQLITGINREVGSSILEAGVLSLASVRHAGSSGNTKAQRIASEVAATLWLIQNLDKAD